MPVDNPESLLIVEIRLEAGTMICIHGRMIAARLHEIIAAGYCSIWMEQIGTGLYNKPVDMRKSFNDLSDIVTNAMSCHWYGGDVFIFVNSIRNRMKSRYKEEDDLLYSSCNQPNNHRNLR